MEIIEYAPERKQEFIDLNTWWIERYFDQIEQADWDEFNHVDEEIARGGMVFFAVDDEGVALATCMAIARGNDEWEIAKLGSHPPAQRLRQGRVRGMRGVGRSSRRASHLHSHE